MGNSRWFLGAFAAAIAAAGCAKPAMISNRAPGADLADGARVAVLVANDSTELRMGVERAFATMSGGKGPTFVPATELLGPGLIHQTEDLLNLLHEQKFDLSKALARRTLDQLRADRVVHRS